MGLGVEGLLEEARSNSALTMGEYVDLRSGLVRLLDPRATGGFRVLVFGRGIAATPALRGLSFRLPGARSRPIDRRPAFVRAGSPNLINC